MALVLIAMLVGITLVDKRVILAYDVFKVRAALPSNTLFIRVGC